MSDTADHAFAELFQAKKQLKASKGQLVCSPREQPKGVFYIHAGYVKAYDIDAGGSNQIIGLFGPGDLFPLLWALDGDEPRLFYETITPLTFSLCSRDEFTAATRADIALMRAITALLLRASRHFQQRIQNLELKTAQQKVAYRLLFLGTRFGRRDGNRIVIALPVRYQDLAESLNMNRDTVNRVMRELASTGCVEKRSHAVTIMDAEALTAILGSETALEF